jgi:hypothetical protein
MEQVGDMGSNRKTDKHTALVSGISHQSELLSLLQLSKEARMALLKIEVQAGN